MEEDRREWKRIRDAASATNSGIILKRQRRRVRTTLQQFSKAGGPFPKEVEESLTNLLAYLDETD